MRNHCLLFIGKLSDTTHHTRYKDTEGYEVIVLNSKTDWVVPWWTWLILGVFILMILTCATNALLKAIGVITEDLSAK